MEPEVTTLAATALMRAAHLKLSAYDNAYNEGNPGELLIEFSGRTCYQSHHNPADRTNDEYIKNIIRQKHYSVLEHANITFLIEGVSRSFTHELIRHRHHSYSQLSQRYVDQSDARFVCPPLIRSVPALVDRWVDHNRSVHSYLEQSEQLYFEHYPDLPKKQVREAVRADAPNCIETKIVVTGNLRAWREYLEKRWNSHADAEIQEVSEMLASRLKINYPSVFEDIEYH